MKVKSAGLLPNSKTAYEFYVEAGTDIQYGDVFEYNGQKYAVSNFPKDFIVTDDGELIVETRFTADVLP